METKIILALVLAFLFFSAPMHANKGAGSGFTDKKNNMGNLLDDRKVRGTDAICMKVEDPKLCKSVLGENPDVSPEQALDLNIKGVIDDTNDALTVVDDKLKSETNPQIKAALELCKGVYSKTLGSVQNYKSLMDKHSTFELSNMLNLANADVGNCADNFEIIGTPFAIANANNRLKEQIANAYGLIIV